MTSRIAIIALLATGALMGSAGAALGASALSTDTSASALQYGQGKQDVALAGSGSSGPSAGGPAGPGANSPAGSRPAVAGVTSDTPTAAAQAPRQLEAASADSLPFTGYAAIPLLLIGLALLTCGLVLRRSTGRQSSSLSAA